jgi:hypothetical protein
MATPRRNTEFKKKTKLVFEFPLIYFINLKISENRKSNSWARSQNYEKRQSDSSFLSVHPSVRPHGTPRFPLDGFS